MAKPVLCRDSFCDGIVTSGPNLENGYEHLTFATQRCSESFRCGPQHMDRSQVGPKHQMADLLRNRLAISLLRQGQRTLSRLQGKDFGEEVIAPSGDSSFASNAMFTGMLS